MNQRVFTAALIVALLGVSVPAAAEFAWEPDVRAIEAGGFRVDYQSGKELLYVEEEGNNGGTVVTARSTDMSTFSICIDLGENWDCGLGKPVEVNGQVELPFCGDFVENCIEALEVAGPDGVFTTSTYKGTTAGTKFSGDKVNGIPAGAGPAIFESEVANSASNEYTIKAMMRVGLRTLANGQKEFGTDEFSLRVFATEQSARPGTLPAIAEVQPLTQDGKENSIGVSGVQGCIYQDVDICGKELSFAPSTSFRVTLNLSNKLTGWFRGRLQEPNISINPIDDRSSRFVIEGKPVEVPRFLSTFDLSAGDPDIVGPLNQN
ncbi:MAG: hypothetical protein RI917_660, partial [Actinomycetota bacterium]